MTHEEFVQKNKLLGERLDEIARLTEGMACWGTAEPSNPVFCELMAAQEECLRKAERLVKEYEAY